MLPEHSKRCIIPPKTKEDSAPPCYYRMGSLAVNFWRSTGVSISPRAFASRNSVKKLRRDGEARKRVADKSTASEDDYVQIDKKVDPSDNLAAEELVVFLPETWPDFAESSEAANQQELLFRGALLPLFGSNWRSALAVAIIFGVLHLGSGRKATFVGLVYGYATIVSSSLIVPMAAHAVNNLVGGISWRYRSGSPRRL
ncbi:CAAX amino terminal protease family protein [Prunus dulcis]|uniref:CAAX amino terminal protease family protein n=1 Tax=Prunus dulcis TaxID=3755 RepID=A0A4Y1QQ30_PRUDU|nr:CAAX amino terminal protease family protein [Prunus dulcis]